MRVKILLLLLALSGTMGLIQGQESETADSMRLDIALNGSLTTGWADEAVTIGYVTTPSVVTLMFVSALINEWNAGYVGIPASLMILAAPPLIYAGGRSVGIPKNIYHPRAKLGWTLYALSIIPTAMALYGFTTDWGATLPLTIASGLLGAGSIVAMTSYAFSRAETARQVEAEKATSLQFGLAPMNGGALACLVIRF